MSFKNLTPHALCIVDSDGTTVLTLDKPPEGTPIPRVSTLTEKRFEHEGVNVYASEFGDVENLPDQQEGTFLVVSALVRTACPDRKDLLSPGQLVRDEDGKPVGCQGLTCNP